MKNQLISGFGGARKQLEIEVARLFLDSQNPRLPEGVQGKKEEEILKVLYKEFDIDELAFSMAENGYFDEEPLVAIPKNLPAKFKNKSPQALRTDSDYDIFLKDSSTEFIVVEGNRRLAAIKLLLNLSLRKQFRIGTWPNIGDEVKKDISKPPVIIYSTRKQVLPYLGVRHIAGIKKWEAFAKARYVASMMEEDMTLEDVERLVGDRNGATKKIYVCYRLVKQGEKLGVDVTKAKEYFSYLQLSLGQASIKDFLGLTGRLETYVRNNPVPKNKTKNLKKFLVWLYGDKKNKPVIRESRDITNKLTQVLESSEARSHLVKTNNLFDSGIKINAYTRNDQSNDVAHDHFCPLHCFWIDCRFFGS